MTTQGVVTQTAGLSGNTTGSSASKGKRSGTGFEILFGTSLRSEQYAADKTQNTKRVKSSQQASDKSTSNTKDASVKDTAQTDMIASASGTDASASAGTKQTQETGKKTSSASDVKVTETAKEEEVEPVIDEKTMEKIAEMLQMVKETIMEALNLSDEQFNQLLTEQGFTLENLIQPENLQQMILANSGQTDLLAVLTDENLADTMKLLIQKVEDIKADMGSGITEEQLKRLIDCINEKSDEFSTASGAMEAASDEHMAPVHNVTVSVENDTQGKTSVSDVGEIQQDTGAEGVRNASNAENLSQEQANQQEENNQDIKAAERFDAFVENLAGALDVNQTNFDGNMIHTTQLREIANQIIEQVKITIRPDQTSMELQLNPEHLGRVNLSVQSQNGIMTAHFIVQNDISREAIESQLHTLRETLNQQGIKVDAIEVTVSDYSFEQGAGEQSGMPQGGKNEKSRSRISLENLDGTQEEAQDSDDMEEITEGMGSRIDYTA